MTAIIINGTYTQIAVVTTMIVMLVITTSFSIRIICNLPQVVPGLGQQTVLDVLRICSP